MRFPRALGVALLVLVAIAALDAAPATARKVVLCQANESFCKKANVSKGEFTANAGAVLNFGAAGTVECASSMTQSEIGKVSALTFSECSEGCTVKAGGLPFSASYSSVGGGDAVLTLFGVGGHVTLAVKCKTSECVYADSLVETMFDGGEPGRVEVDDPMVEEEKSFFCPEAMAWEGIYEISSPAFPLYAANRGVEGPSFCVANVAKCPQESIATVLAAGTFGAGMEIGNFAGGGKISCAGFFEIQDEEFEAEGPWRYKPGSFTKCTSATYTACEVRFKSDPYKALLTPLGEGEGLVGVAKGPGGGEPTLQVSCTYLKVPYTCVYKTPEFFLFFEAGSPPFMYEGAKYKKVEGSAAFCSTEVALSAEYISTFPAGKALFLTEAES